MPSEQLIQYVKENLNKGFTEDQLKTVLLQAGYPEYEIDQVFHQINDERATPTVTSQLRPNATDVNAQIDLQSRVQPVQQSATQTQVTPVSEKGQKKLAEGKLSTIAFALMLLGLVMLSFVLSLPLVFICGLGRTGILVTYFLVLLTGVGIGYLIFWIALSFGLSVKRMVITGVVAPSFALAAISFVFAFTRKILSARVEFYGRLNPNLDVSLLAIKTHSPLLTSLLFYLVVNSFILWHIFRKNKKRELKWYLVGLPVYIVNLLVSYLFASAIVARAIH